MLEPRIKTRSLHPVFGAEVLGVSVKQQLNSEFGSQLRALVEKHGLLVLRDQVLSDEDLFALCCQLGTQWGIHARDDLPPARRVSRLSNIDEQGNILAPGANAVAMSRANQLWHTDATYTRPRAAISCLYSHAVPASGGDTEFCDTIHAYDLLPPALREEIEPLFAHHSIIHSRRLTGYIMAEVDPQSSQQFISVRRPLVHTHSESGRKALCVASHIESIDGYGYEQARQLVERLIDIAAGADCVHAHHWKAHDLLLWDNVRTMHRARPYRELEDIRDLRFIRTIDPSDAP